MLDNDAHIARLDETFDPANFEWNWHERDAFVPGHVSELQIGCERLRGTTTQFFLRPTKIVGIIIAVERESGAGDDRGHWLAAIDVATSKIRHVFCAVNGDAMTI